MSFPTGIKHTLWAGPWHHCARCDRKTKIAKMQWQRGKLLCLRYCYDNPEKLLGVRDARIAAVLEDGKSEYELAPVEKLRDPSIEVEPEDFLI